MQPNYNYIVAAATVLLAASQNLPGAAAAETSLQVRHTSSVFASWRKLAYVHFFYRK